MCRFSFLSVTKYQTITKCKGHVPAGNRVPSPPQSLKNKTVRHKVRDSYMILIHEIRLVRRSKRVSKTENVKETITCINKLLQRYYHKGKAMTGNLSVPGRPAYLDNSRVRANCACCRCGWRFFRHFFSCLSFFSFSSTSLTLGDSTI